MTNEDRAAWLAGLKVGDEVFIQRHGIVKVERFTPTLVIVGKRQFYRVNGRERTSGYHGGVIQPVTDEIRGIVEKQSLVLRLERVNWRDADVDQLRAIVAILDAPATSEETAE